MHIENVNLVNVVLKDSFMQYQHNLSVIGSLIVKMKRSEYYLDGTMGIPILERWLLCTETTSWASLAEQKYGMTR